MTAPAYDEQDATILPLISDKPTSSIVFVTPEMATRWLERNAKNRRLREVDIRRYARDMAAGKWQITGEGIKFATTGELLDGQHRLTAIIRTGVTVPLLVFRGISPEAQKVMDTGRKRTAADALTIAQESNSVLLAATIRLALGVDSGLADPGHYQATHAEVEQYLIDHPEVRDRVNEVVRLSRKTDCQPAVVAYTYYRLSQIDQREAFQFCYDAAEKIGLREGDPILALINRLAEARRNRQKLTKPILLSLIYRTWNARRDGKTQRMIRVMSPSGGVVPIPEPK